MNSKKILELLKSLLPHLLAVVVLYIVCVAYFSAILDGKDIQGQMDKTHSIGMAKELIDYDAKTGGHALWTNSMFGGMPAYQIKGGQSYSIYGYIMNAMHMKLPGNTAGILIAILLSFYILFASLGVNKWLSVAGSLAASFSTYNLIIIAVGHITKAYAIGFMGPVIAGVILTYRKKYIAGGILTTIGLGLEIYANHIQITYYLMLLIVVLGIAEFIFAVLDKELKSFFKATAVLVVAVLLGVLPNITNLLLTNEYGQETMRGARELASDVDKNKSGLDKDYALRWSYGKAETFTLLIPNFVGGESKAIGDNPALKNVDPQVKDVIAQQSQYWGDQPFTSGPVYAGAIICFLFVLGLFIVDKKLKWWLLAATILGIVLSWGRNFEFVTDFFFNYVPMYNKFRTVSMALVISSVTMPLLGILAVQKIIDSPKIIIEKRKEFFISLALTAGVALLFYIIMPMNDNFFLSGEEINNFNEMLSNPKYKEMVAVIQPALVTVRASIFKADAMRSIIFILLGAGVIYAYVSMKFKTEYMVCVLALLILIDLWAIDKRHLNNDQFVPKRIAANQFVAAKADEFILKDTDPYYRVFNLRNPFNEVNTSYFHKSIGGYHGAKLRRYQDVIDTCLSRSLEAITGTLKANPNMEAVTAILKTQNALNMLNAKYIIYNPDALPIVNFNALGNAWFVNNYKIVNNPNEELGAINTFNPLTTAVIDKKFDSYIEKLPKPENDSLARNLIKLIEYKPDGLTYQTNTQKEKLAVFSEIYYNKGWQAYIDEKPVEHIRVNYILRAMLIPAGKHKIEFKFEPATYFLGQKISLISSILVVILLLTFLGFYFYKEIGINKKPVTT